MVISKTHLDELTKAKFELLKSKKIIKDHLEKLASGIEKDFSSLSELALPEVCNERAKFFNLEGTRPEDYQERILKINCQKFIMAGIRFRGLNVSKPFVSINANFVMTKEQLSPLGALISKEFSVFKPQAFQFNASSEIEINNGSLEIDRYTVAGKVSEALKAKLPPTQEKIEIKKLKDMSFYDEYLKEYQIFHTKVPVLADEVKPESLEDFNESCESGLLYQILINEKRAGIIAGLPHDLYGMPGVCILEEILYDSFKGKGIGAHAQRAFMEAITNRYNILWGTISHENQSSLKTALKNGRKIEEISYLFLL